MLQCCVILQGLAFFIFYRKPGRRGCKLEMSLKITIKNLQFVQLRHVSLLRDFPFQFNPFAFLLTAAASKWLAWSHTIYCLHLMASAWRQVATMGAQWFYWMTTRNNEKLRLKSSWPECYYGLVIRNFRSYFVLQQRSSIRAVIFKCRKFFANWNFLVVAQLSQHFISNWPF